MALARFLDFEHTRSSLAVVHRHQFTKLLDYRWSQASSVTDWCKENPLENSSQAAPVGTYEIEIASIVSVYETERLTEHQPAGTNQTLN